MESAHVQMAVEAEAKAFNVDPDLAVAIAMVETNLNQFALRFEPEWKYLYEVDKFAKIFDITSDTEKMLQSMSWGCMQVMGSVARELGFLKPLVLLTGAWEGAELGCHKLSQIIEKYPDQNDTIAVYNAGSVRKDENGRYVNQNYVDSVNKKLWELKKAQR